MSERKTSKLKAFFVQRRIESNEPTDRMKNHNHDYEAGKVLDDSRMPKEVVRKLRHAMCSGCGREQGIGGSCPFSSQARDTMAAAGGCLRGDAVVADGLSKSWQGAGEVRVRWFSRINEYEKQTLSNGYGWGQVPKDGHELTKVQIVYLKNQEGGLVANVANVEGLVNSGIISAEMAEGNGYWK